MKEQIIYNISLLTHLKLTLIFLLFHLFLQISLMKKTLRKKKSLHSNQLPLKKNTLRLILIICQLLILLIMILLIIPLIMTLLIIPLIMTPLIIPLIITLIIPL